MSHSSRPIYWPIAAVLLALFLAFDLCAKQARPQDWAVLPLSPEALTAAIAASPVRVQYLPDPNDIVNLAEGTPYTVPAGKLLIITDWVTTNIECATNALGVSLIQPAVLVNGTQVWGGGFSSTREASIGAMTTSGAGVTSGAFRSGIRANAGDTVTLVTVKSPASGFFNAPRTFAAGYLAAAE